MIINLHNLYLSWRHIPVYSTSFKLVVTVTRRDRSDRSHDSDGGRRGCLKLPYDCHGGSHAMARIGTTCHNHGTIMAQCSRMYLNRVMIEATIAAAKQRITVYNHTPSRRRRLTARETPWHGAWDAVSLRRESRRRLTTRAMSLGAYSPRKSPTGPDGRESLAPLRLGPPWVCGWSVQCLWQIVRQCVAAVAMLKVVWYTTVWLPPTLPSVTVTPRLNSPNRGWMRRHEKCKIMRINNYW